MNDLVSIPQATAAVVNNAHRATQGIRAVVACIAEAMGVEHPEVNAVQPRTIPEAVQGFATAAQTLANAFGGLADLFERVSEPVQIEAAPEPVQIEQSKPQEIEQASEPAPETLTIPAEVEGDPDPFCEKEETIAEERAESIENDSTAEPDFLPDGDPVNRMASYDSEPSVNGGRHARGKRGKKGGK